METFEHLRRAKTVLLSTRRRDGSTVDTPVNLVVDEDGVAYFRTWSTSGKARRLRNFPGVRVAPCSFTGRPQGSDLGLSGPRLATRPLPQHVAERPARLAPIFRKRAWILNRPAVAPSSFLKSFRNFAISSLLGLHDNGKAWLAPYLRCPVRRMAFE